MIKKVLLLTLLAIVAESARSQDQISGFWMAQEGKTIVEISRVDPVYQEGTIVWLESPNNRKGEPLTDQMNPDKQLRDQTILGLTMLKDLVYKNGQWFGKLYAPKRGKTLDVALSLPKPDELQLDVSFRGFRKTQTWVKTTPVP